MIPSVPVIEAIAAGGDTVDAPREWRLHTAKARLREVFRVARSEGPQRITRPGREAVVVVAAEEYGQLLRRPPTAVDLATLLAASPLVGMNLDLERPRDDG